VAGHPLHNVNRHTSIDEPSGIGMTQVQARRWVEPCPDKSRFPDASPTGFDAAAHQCVGGHEPFDADGIAGEMIDDDLG
jgi:hypothetical protein